MLCASMHMEQQSTVFLGLLEMNSRSVMKELRFLALLKPCYSLPEKNEIPGCTMIGTGAELARNIFVCGLWFMSTTTRAWSLLIEDLEVDDMR